MNSHKISHKILRPLIFLLALFACTASNAWWHGGGGYRGGGYYHGGGGYYHGGGYYRGGYGGYGYRGWGPGVVVGVPIGGYYGAHCTYVRQCYRNGNCFNRRVCN